MGSRRRRPPPIIEDPDPLWEEGDEIPVEASFFNSSSVKQEDPLALDGDDHESPPRPSSTRGTTRSGSKRSVNLISLQASPPAKKKGHSIPPPPPIKPSVGLKSSSASSNLPSYKNAAEFRVEMTKNIAGIMEESIKLFGMDPREYHPFYLRVYKYITIGQQLGYIKTAQDVHSCWEKYDKVCGNIRMMGGGNPKGAFTGVESPYATYILTRKVVVNGKELKLKRNEEEVKKRFVELEKFAKDIVKAWKTKKRKKNNGSNSNSNSSSAIRDDLTERLKFFEQCKSMTFPADCVKMNQLWSKFLHEFSDGPAKKTLSETKKTGTGAGVGASSSGPILSLTLDDKYEKGAHYEDVDDYAAASSPIEVDLDPVEEKGPAVENSGAPSKQSSKPIKIRQSGSSSKVKTVSKPTKSLPEEQATTKKNTSDSSGGEMKTTTSQRKNMKIKRIMTLDGSKRLAKLKVAHARKKLKSKGSLPMKKQAKLETLICSGSYFSKIKSNFSTTKRGLGKETATEKEQEPQSGIPTSLMPSAVAVDVDNVDKSVEADSSTDQAKVVEAVYNVEAEVAPLIVNGAGSAPKRKQTDEPVNCCCDQCGIIFSRYRDLKTHQNARHNPNTETGMRKCPVCLQEFVRLWKHFAKVHMKDLDLEQDKDTAGASSNSVTIQALKMDPAEAAITTNSRTTEGCCELCGKIFLLNGPSSLKRHLEQIHGSGEKVFSCQDCPKQFKSRDTLDAHHRQVHLGDNFRCDICNRVMQTKGKLWKHKVDVHGMTDLEPPQGVFVMQCDICGEKMLRGLLQHMEKIHPEHFETQADAIKKALHDRLKQRKRENSKKVRYKETEMRANERKKVLRKQFNETGLGPDWLMYGSLKIPPRKCPHCEEVFVYTARYLLHLKEAHGIDKKHIWTCPYPSCQKSFVRKSRFDSHVQNGDCRLPLMHVLRGIRVVRKVDGKYDEWVCVFCDHLKSMSYEEMKIHFVLQHVLTMKKIHEYHSLPLPTVVNEKATKCPYCEEEHMANAALREHIEQSHLEMCCQCPECELVMVFPTDLQEHFVLEHTDPDPFVVWEKNKEMYRLNRKNTTLYRRRHPGHQRTTDDKRRKRRTVKPPPVAGRSSSSSTGSAKKRAIGRIISSNKGPTRTRRRAGGRKTSNGDSSSSENEAVSSSKSIAAVAGSSRRSTRTRKPPSRFKEYSEEKYFARFQLKPCHVPVTRLTRVEIDSYLAPKLI